MVDFQELTDGEERNVVIYNLPARLVSGPYVLKEYAFANYFYERDKPRTKVANFVTLDETHRIAWPLKDPLLNSSKDKLILVFDSSIGRLMTIKP